MQSHFSSPSLLVDNISAKSLRVSEIWAIDLDLFRSIFWESHEYTNSSCIYKLVMPLVCWDRLWVDICECSVAPNSQVVNRRGFACISLVGADDTAINYWSSVRSISDVGVVLYRFIPELNWQTGFL